MLAIDTPALTLFAVLITRAASAVPPTVTIALALVCALAGAVALFPILRLGETRRQRRGRTATAQTAAGAAPAENSPAASA